MVRRFHNSDISDYSEANIKSKTATDHWDPQVGPSDSKTRKKEGVRNRGFSRKRGILQLSAGYRRL